VYHNARRRNHDYKGGTMTDEPLTGDGKTLQQEDHDRQQALCYVLIAAIAVPLVVAFLVAVLR
jgi:hypothetical protein